MLAAKGQSSGVSLFRESLNLFFPFFFEQIELLWQELVIYTLLAQKAHNKSGEVQVNL